jgi:hypothetical protein
MPFDIGIDQGAASLLQQHEESVRGETANRLHAMGKADNQGLYRPLAESKVVDRHPIAALTRDLELESVIRPQLVDETVQLADRAESREVRQALQRLLDVDQHEPD